MKRTVPIVAALVLIGILAAGIAAGQALDPGNSRNFA